MGAATTVWHLFFGRILDGLLGGNISLAQAYISGTKSTSIDNSKVRHINSHLDITQKEDRSKAFGFIGAGTSSSSFFLVFLPFHPSSTIHSHVLK